jgi:hypothetical protein
MQRLLLLLLCCFLFTNLGFGQNQLTGRVFENKTNVFLQSVKVEDLKSHAVTLTQVDGSFIIKAAVGDLVTFVSGSYKPDTIYVANLNYIQVFLDLRQNMLQEVKVTNQQIKGNAGFNAQPETGPLGSRAVTYQTDANGDFKGGVNFNIPDGQNTKRKHESQVTEDEKQKEEIIKVFSADNLKKFLPITGQEMANFIILYMPDVKTYYSPAFSLIGYLNTSYQEFVKIPVEQRQSKALTDLKGN